MEKIKLRSKQIKYLLTSPHFSSTKLLEESVYRSYSSTEDLNFYKDIAYAGLQEFEMPVQSSIETLSNEMLEAGKATPRVLVIGCGTGREAFALESLPVNIYAMDIVPQMIETAQKCAQVIDSKVKFFSNCFPNLNNLDEHRVDFIFISSFVLNFIQGHDNRIHYLAKLRNLLRPNGKIYIHPSIEKISFSSLEYISSKLLKLNSWVHGWKYEKGDHAISTFRGNGELMYFYHYPTEKAFLREVLSAGYECEKISEDWFSLS